MWSPDIKLGNYEKATQSVQMFNRYSICELGSRCVCECEPSEILFTATPVFKCLKPSLCVTMVQSVFVMPAFNFTCMLLSHFLLMKGETAATGVFIAVQKGCFVIKCCG